jgi:predicted dehydrogenase
VSDASTIRVAVIGVGSFGRNHARIYADLAKNPVPGLRVELAAIVDADNSRAGEVAKEFGAKVFSDIEQMLQWAKVDAVSVAVPTSAHLKAAEPLLEAGVDVLIEKPLTSKLFEADDLVRIANRTHRIVQVGHLERFNPAVRAVLPLVTKPMFFEVHRLSIFTPRSLDVDVVLDLMIHDIDVVLSLVNSPVKEIRAVGLPVLTNKVDIANVRVEFDSGAVANFTASRVSTERVRKLRFFQPHEYVSIDYSRRDVFRLSVKPAPNPVADSATGFAMPEVVPSKPQVVDEEPLRAELRSFLEAVRDRSKPVVTLDDGRRALSVALDILKAIQEHSRRTGLDALTAGHTPGD